MPFANELANSSSVANWQYVNGAAIRILAACTFAVCLLKSLALLCCFPVLQRARLDKNVQATVHTRRLHTSPPHQPPHLAFTPA